MATAVAAAADALGGLTCLVNNAGVGNVMPLADYPDAEWDRLVDVNLRGTFHGLRAALPLLREAGGTGLRGQRGLGQRPAPDPGRGARTPRPRPRSSP